MGSFFLPVTEGCGRLLLLRAAPCLLLLRGGGAGGGAEYPPPLLLLLLRQSSFIIALPILPKGLLFAVAVAVFFASTATLRCRCRPHRRPNGCAVAALRRRAATTWASRLSPRRSTSFSLSTADAASTSQWPKDTVAAFQPWTDTTSACLGTPEKMIRLYKKLPAAELQKHTIQFFPSETR